jgi:DNA-binding GntR family transcriptional regulator
MVKRAIPSLTVVGPDALHVPATDTAASRTLIERAYAELREDIIEGVLAPGEKLRVEHLKDRYQVGAGTLREAITRLVSDALAVTEGQRGFRVAPVAIEDLQDLTQLRVHIEIEALRQSVRRGGATWRAQLEAAYNDLSSLEQPIRLQHRRRWELSNQRFHESLTAAAASPWTHKVLRLLSRQAERYRRYTIALSPGARDVHNEHREIFEHAMAGSEFRAALALEAHIRATPDMLSRALRDGLPVFERLASPARTANTPD